MAERQCEICGGKDRPKNAVRESRYSVENGWGKRPIQVCRRCEMKLRETAGLIAAGVILI